MKKIVLNSQGSLGDIRPCLALGLTLRKAGFEIEICAPPNFEQLYSRHGFIFHSVGFDSQKFLEEQAQDLMGRQSGKSMNTVMRMLQESMADQFIQLTEAVKGADLLIGSEQDFVGRSVAEYFGIPYRFSCLSPLFFKSRYLAPIGFPFQKAPGWMNLFLWRVADNMMNKKLGSVINTNRKILGLEGVDSLLAYTVENTIVVADPVLTTIPNDVCTNYIQTGYWYLEEEEQELDNELNQFIEAGPPPVYVGFGSMTDPSPVKTAEILQKLIGLKRFRLIISKGWAKLGVNCMYDNVYLIDQVSHAKLFPKIGAVVHHGGAGTTHTASRAGVPQVIIPHMLDQFYWGERVSNLQIGPKSINRTQLSHKKLIAAVEEAVTNSIIQQKASEIGKILSQKDGLTEALNYIKTIVS